MQDVRRQLTENDVASGGVMDKDFEFIAGESGFKTRQAGEANSIAQQEATRGLTEKIGEAAAWFGKLAGEYPGLVGGMTTATTALVAFAGATGLATAAMGVKSGAVGKVAGALRAGVSGTGRAIAGGAGRLQAARGLSLTGAAASAGVGTTLAGVAAAGAAGYAAGEYVANPLLNWAARTATGSEHETFGTWLYSLFNKDQDEKIQQMLAPTELPQKPVEVNAQMQIGLDPGLVLKSQTMRAEGGNVRLNTGNMMTGAPS